MQSLCLKITRALRTALEIRITHGPAKYNIRRNAALPCGVNDWSVAACVNLPIGACTRMLDMHRAHARPRNCPHMILNESFRLTPPMQKKAAPLAL